MANPNITTDGSVSYAANSRQWVYESGRISGDFYFEFTTDSATTPAILNDIGVFAVGTPLITYVGGTPDFTLPLCGFYRFISNADLDLFDNGALLGTSFAAAAGDRLSIIRTGHILKLYKNYINAVTEPLLISQVVASGDYKIGMWHDGNTDATILKARLRTDRMAYLYTAAAQTADFGSTQSSVKTRVSEESAIVGRGPYTEANL